jgi:hypothetical protein
MTKKFHLCQSVTGPLRNWTKRDWKAATRWITREDGSKFMADELKDLFLEELSKGHKVIPIGKCDNFDWKEGCLGHTTDDKARLK